MAIRRRLTCIAACRICGSIKFKKDAIAVECAGCGAIRARRPGDERLVATMMGWDDCPLSRSELRVLRALFGGKTHSEVALEQGRSASTIRGHLSAVYSKLGVPGALQACLLAHERGWFLPNTNTTEVAE